MREQLTIYHREAQQEVIPYLDQYLQFMIKERGFQLSTARSNLNMLRLFADILRVEYGLKTFDPVEVAPLHIRSYLEVEEVCFGQPIILKSKQPAKGVNPIYYALGQTDAGRYLFVMFIYLKQGRTMLVTAREMDQKEKKYYQRRC